MSNALAIAAVTATLRNLLNSGVNGDAVLGFTRVTTQPPDKARGTSDNDNQLNLFLFQTTVNATWRNMDMPRQVQPGEVGQPPLALNLHYMITAYSRDNDDVLGHRVLGRAMSTLHDHPLLGAEEIKIALADGDLGDQIERVRITPEPIGLEELSKLWTTFQTQYRISAAYQVAVVLIESSRATRAALPVLTRGPGDQGIGSQADLTPPFPTLTEALPPNRQPAVRLGDTLRLIGFKLGGPGVTGLRLRFTTSRLSAPIEVAVPPPADPTEVAFVIPNDSANWPAGFYTVSAVVSATGEQDRVTNEVPFALAPKISLSPTNAAPGNLTLTVTCAPEVRPEQRAALLFGDREIVAEPRNAPTGTLTFNVADVVAGVYFVRLRVDGVDSLLVNRAVTPPVFFDDQKVTIS